MADVTIRVTLRGEGVKSGTIDLRRLIDFGDQIQTAIDRLALSLERELGRNVDRKLIKPYTALSLVDIGESSTALELAPTEVDGLPLYPDLLRNTVENFIDGVIAIEEYPERIPAGWDQGVLRVVNDIGKTLSHGISELEFDVQTPRVQRQAIYNQPLRENIQGLFAQPEERIEGIIGKLLIVNFKGDRYDTYRCHIYPDDDSRNSMRCIFEEDISGEIETAVRKTVGAIGVAKINPVTDEPEHLRVRELIIYDGTEDREIFELRFQKQLRDYRNDFDTEASLSRAWGELLAGEAFDVSRLWEDLDAE